MAYIFQADIYCDSCGERIKESLTMEGKEPEDPYDEYTFDSDDFPKYVDDDEESDSPQHCAAGHVCLEAETLSDGSKIGHLIGTNLTREGVQYLKESVEEGGLVADFWRENFNWVWLDFP